MDSKESASIPSPQPRPNPRVQKNWDKIVDDELDKLKKEKLEKQREEWKKKEEEEKKNPPPKPTIKTVLEKPAAKSELEYLEDQLFKWTQSMDEVFLTVFLPEPTPKQRLEIIIQKRNLRIYIRGQSAPLLDRRFRHLVNPSDSMWTLVDQKEIHIDLKKGDMGKQPVWEALFEGQREVTPFRGIKDVVEADDEPERYDDLDPATRRIVDKLRKDEMKKAQGLPGMNWDEYRVPFVYDHGEDNE